MINNDNLGKCFACKEKVKIRSYCGNCGMLLNKDTDYLSQSFRYCICPSHKVNNSIYCWYCGNLILKSYEPIDKPINIGGKFKYEPITTETCPKCKGNKGFSVKTYITNEGNEVILRAPKWHECDWCLGKGFTDPPVEESEFDNTSKNVSLQEDISFLNWKTLLIVILTLGAGYLIWSFLN
ncbi:MAG: hypothetical protein R2824_16060 [Saprospiraceae bacterium]